MPTRPAPSPAPTLDRVVARVAERALTRTTALALPAPADGAYAAAARACAAGYATARAHAAAAQDELYVLAGQAGQDGDERTAVALPLRRAIHNHRAPGERLERAGRALGLPAVTAWLDGMAAADRAASEMAREEPAALATARRTLAMLCADEGFQRGVALTSPTLLHAVRRAAERQGELDRRAAKSEATVLRQVLRAATRTSPLTWFAHVGWAEPGATEHPALPRATARLDLAELATVVRTVVADLPAGDVPLRLADEHHRRGDRHVFLRTDPDSLRRLVELPASAPVDAICARLRAGAATAASLGAPALVRKLREVGLLVPDEVLDEQSPTLTADLAAWLRAVGRPGLADDLDALAAAAHEWPACPAERRGAALADLERRWTALLGRPPATVLTEDVTTAAVTSIVPPRVALAALEPLLACFDWFGLVRRAAVTRFVAAYGAGGRCPSVAEYGALYDGIWRDRDVAAQLVDDPTAAELLAARAALADRVVRGAEDVLPADALVLAAERLPAGLRTRPVSYSIFAVPAGPRWVVNEVYGGWGRFTSRFLDHLPAAAAQHVAADLRATLPGRVAQLRPSEHYAANLHPLLVDDEIGTRGTLPLDDLEIVHDPDADELRVQVAATGQRLDVLYLGFLVPMALPRPVAALVNDLGSGLVDLRPLRTEHRRATWLGTVGELPRLRCGELVLGRRTWLFGSGAADALAAALADPGQPAAVTVARLRAELDLPEHVFVGAGPDDDRELPGVTAFTARMGRSRAQYVDLTDALHVRHLGKTLARHAGGLRLEEALPAPVTGRPVRELVFETYRPAGQER